MIALKVTQYDAMFMSYHLNRNYGQLRWKNCSCQPPTCYCLFAKWEIFRVVAIRNFWHRHSVHVNKLLAEGLQVHHRWKSQQNKIKY